LAAEAGLDVDRFRKDLESGSQRSLVGEEHEEAITEWGAFGVPTLVYPSGEAIYLKLGSGDWEGQEDDGLFEQMMSLFATRPYLVEVKKPASAGFVKKT
jgi:protein-disulfide isomerase-like protein with CxxC motif